MKKIGILTFHRSKNYGAYLQCFALCKQLERNFPEAKIEVIDYTRAAAEKAYRIYQIKSCIKNPKFIRDTVHRNHMFKSFLQYLPISQEKVCSDNISDFLEKFGNSYDIVIVGSDVVWSVNEKLFPLPYWLEGINAKKMSYAAASHGTNYQALSMDARDYCRRMLLDFSYIGTRDISTEQFIQDLIPEKKIFHNCDPTVILDMDDVPCDMVQLKKKMNSIKGFDPKKKTIGVMLADRYITELIKQHFAAEYNIIAVYTENPFLPMRMMNLTIFEWANVFSLFDITITTFFHGTLFSLKNGTPVIALNLKELDEKYAGKTEDILTRLDMSDHFLHIADIKKSENVFLQKMTQLLKEKDSNTIYNALSKEQQFFYSFEEALRDLVKNE